jgi:hypothetical protein
MRTSGRPLSVLVEKKACSVRGYIGRTPIVVDVNAKLDLLVRHRPVRPCFSMLKSGRRNAAFDPYVEGLERCDFERCDR